MARRIATFVGFALTLSFAAHATPAGCTDADRDGICDLDDSCPTVPNPNQARPYKLNHPIALDRVVARDALSPDGTRVVYEVRPDGGTEPFFSLHSVPPQGGMPVPVLAQGDVADVEEFAISPDSTRVLVRGLPAKGGGQHLYSLPIEGGTLVTLNGALAPGGDVESFATCGTKVVYRADQEADGVLEIYRVPIGGGEPIKLNPTPVAGGLVADYVIDPTCSRVLYRADQEVDEAFELFSVPIDGGEPIRLNPPLLPGADVRENYAIDQGGAWVVFGVDDLLADTFDIYGVPIAGGTAVVLSGPSRTPTTFTIDPAGQRAILRQDGSLWSVPLHLGWDAASGLGPCPNAPECVYAVTPRSDRVVFTPGDFLYSAPIGGGAPLQITATVLPSFPYGRNSFSAKVVSLEFLDAETVLFFTGWTLVDGGRLWRVPVVPAAAGEEFMLHPLLHENDLIHRYVVAPNGRDIVISFQSPQLSGLYRIPAQGGPLTSLGDSYSTFYVTPDSATVVFRNWVDTLELFAVPLLGIDTLGADNDEDGLGGACDCNDVDPACGATCVDGDLDGIAVCTGDCDGACVIAADCDDADPSLHAFEINDGLDNQCPGSVGSGVIDELRPTLHFDTPTRLCWEPQPEATSYEIVAAADVAFTEACSSSITVETCSEIGAVPPAGAALYLLARPASPFAGSWGIGSDLVPRSVACGMP